MTNWYKLKRHILYIIFLWEGLYIFIYSHLLQYWSYLSMIWLKSLIFNLEYHKVFSKLYKGCLISLRHDDLIETGETALWVSFKLKLIWTHIRVGTFYNWLNTNIFCHIYNAHQYFKVLFKNGSNITDRSFSCQEWIHLESSDVNKAP